MLTNEVSVAPNGGKGFGLRHLDFHPSKPWMYVSVETQNEMYMYGMENGRIRPQIRIRAVTWRRRAISGRVRPPARLQCHSQRARFLYGANRAEATTEFQGKQVFKGGENSIVVYAIDQSTGEHTPIQHIATQKIHPRTFHIDPSGRLLVAQHNLPANVRDGEAVKEIPAGLSVFRIGDDGKLMFVRTYDIDVGNKTIYPLARARPLSEPSVHLSCSTRRNLVAGASIAFISSGAPKVRAQADPQPRRSGSLPLSGRRRHPTSSRACWPSR